MHRRRLIAVIGIAVTAVLLACWGVVRSSTDHPAASAGTPAAAEPPTVVVARVIAQELNRDVRLPGELRAYQDVAVYPKVQGFVEMIAVDRGSMVKQGELLARLVAPELASQRSEAAAKVQAAQAQRLEAEAKLQADVATYDHLKAAAVEPGVVAGNDLEIAQKLAQADRARARAWQENQEAALQALHAVEQIESYLQITAPFDGVITERNVHQGSLVGPAAAATATPMLRLHQITPLRLVVAVPEAEVSGIVAGKQVHFTVPAFPGETFSGTLQRVAHAVDVKTRTMPVELDVPNPAGRLAPGMYAAVAWHMRRPQPSLFVPAAAVVTTTAQTFVLRIRDGVVEWVDVTRGVGMGDAVEVFGDLAAGDQIAAHGTDELRPGTRVRTQAAAN